MFQIWRLKHFRITQILWPGPWLRQWRIDEEGFDWSFSDQAVCFWTFPHDRIREVLHNPAMSCVHWRRFVMLSSLLATVNSNIGSIFRLFVMYIFILS